MPKTNGVNIERLCSLLDDLADARSRSRVRELRRQIQLEIDALVEDKPTVEKKINFDELQEEAEGLLAILMDLKNRRYIFHEAHWGKLVQEHLQRLHKLTSQALGK